MKILTFSGYYTPEIAASMYLTEDILEGLAHEKHEINLYVPNPCRGIDKETAKLYREKKEEKKYGGYLHIHRISMFKEGRNPVFRAIRYFLLTLAFVWKGIHTSADIIFVQSTPPTQGIMAKLVKRWKKIPIVYNLQDIFPDSLANAGMTKRGSLLWKIGRKIENKTYAAADRIIVISEDFKKNILAKGVPEEKIEVIYNWGDTEKIYKVNREDNILFDKYGLDRSLFYISYSGNLGHTQNLDMLLSVAQKMKTKMPDLRFVLIGDGAEKERLATRIQKEQIENVILLPFQDYCDISHVFSLGNVGLIISKKGVGSNSVPSKTYGYMAAERPILASFDQDSQLSKLIREIGCGAVADGDDEDALIDAIAWIREYPQIGIAGKTYLMENLTKEKCVAKYVKTLERVFEESKKS